MMQVLLVITLTIKSNNINQTSRKISNTKKIKKGNRRVLLDLLIGRCCVGVHSTVLLCKCPAENASKAAAAAAVAAAAAKLQP